jgi:hypothetical protein
VLRSHHRKLVPEEQPGLERHPVVWRGYRSLRADLAELAALALLAAPVEGVRGDDHIEWVSNKVNEAGAVLWLFADLWVVSTDRMSIQRHSRCGSA